MAGIFVFGVLVVVGLGALVFYKIKSSRSESRKWAKAEAERSIER
jgi:hypothetical protein